MLAFLLNFLIAFVVAEAAAVMASSVLLLLEVDDDPVANEMFKIFK